MLRCSRSMLTRAVSLALSPTHKSSPSYKPLQAEHEQLHIPSSEQSLSDSPPVLVMEFRVFKDRRLYQVPKGYVERKPGLMIFNEPGKVDWSAMLDNLYDHRYRSCSDVYYIKPGCVPPKGMVLISGEEDVDQMMQVHEGLKKCDLYIVRNCEYSDSDDSEMYGGMSDDDEYPPLGYINIGDRVSDEYGSSPGIVRSPLNNREKALTFDNNDEHADSKN